MSKRWRRTASIHGGAPAATSGAPLVVSVVATDGSYYAVSFNQPVTYDGSGSGTMVIPGESVAWAGQIDPTTIELDSSATPSTGKPWHWSAPDPSLTPTPNPAQTGVTA